MYEHNGETYPPYVKPPKAQLIKQSGKAFELCVDILKELKLNPAEFYVDDVLLAEALIRTDQRVLHYLMYHKGMRMNEAKRLAVFAYWLLRFKPIHRQAGGSTDINEKLVTHLIFKSVDIYRTKKGLPMAKLSPKLKNDFLYTATYREISYDYMTMFIEGLVA